MKNIESWAWVVWNQRLKWKNIEYLSHQKKKHIFFLCMYKMVVKITKETWEKCGIKTVKHYHEKKNIIELWQTVNGLETQNKTFKYFWCCLKKN